MLTIALFTNASFFLALWSSWRIFIICTELGSPEMQKLEYRSFYIIALVFMMLFSLANWTAVCFGVWEISGALG